VLDYGCGSGYGSHFLATHCHSITGVDISADAIAYADSHYRADNLDFHTIAPAERAPLPFADSSFGVVLSFQVIEHIRQVDAYLSEIERVLQPGGVFVCATPDRSTRLLPGQKPWNVWHIREYDREALRHTLATRFTAVEVLGMGGRPDVLALELRRARRLKWLTLPFTLPVTPEFVRIGALRLLKRLNREPQTRTANEPADFGFDESALCIAPDAAPSTNLIAVARKP